MSKQLLKEVKKNPHFETLDNGKIHCKLTGHDLMPDLETFKKYLTVKSSFLNIIITSLNRARAI
jgi:hypothetical protein